MPGPACPRGEAGSGPGGGDARPAAGGALALRESRPCRLRGEPAAYGPATAFAKAGVYPGPRSRPGTHLPVGKTAICRRQAFVLVFGTAPPPSPSKRRTILKCPSPCRLRFASRPPRATCGRREMRLKFCSCELVQDAPMQEGYRATPLTPPPHTPLLLPPRPQLGQNKPEKTRKTKTKEINRQNKQITKATTRNSPLPPPFEIPCNRIQYQARELDLKGADLLFSIGDMNESPFQRISLGSPPSVFGVIRDLRGKTKREGV